MNVEDNFEENVCKYCLEEDIDANNPIIYPCNCTDGVHLNCLAMWFAYSKKNIEKCEVCQKEYSGLLIQDQTGFFSSPPPPPQPRPLPPTPPPPNQTPPPNTHLLQIMIQG